MSALTRDLHFSVRNGAKLEKIAKVVFGEKSVEYLDSLKELAYSYSNQYRIHDAYKVWLKSYDIAKVVFGSEKNQYCSLILVDMAILKSALNEYEDSYNLFAKAKKLEEQVNSKISRQYQNIVQLEEGVRQKEEKTTGKKRKKGRRISRVKLIGGLALFGAIAVGAIYIFKKKK
mmetsp:Transcript_30864/g.27300  ORF Transcript_30864/g.27300 Transcript_30864/m.27300 type:complete len:174 (+) Transcript_30864:1004-1525(+)